MLKWISDVHGSKIFDGFTPHRKEDTAWLYYTLYTGFLSGCTEGRTNHGSSPVTALEQNDGMLIHEK